MCFHVLGKNVKKTFHNKRNDNHNIQLIFEYACVPMYLCLRKYTRFNVWKTNVDVIS